MASDFDFLHVKSRTKGSSNELSFDVLDAAREGLEGGRKSRRDARHATGRASESKGAGFRPARITGMASMGIAGRKAKMRSNSAVPVNRPTYSASPEVERRKRARKASTLRTWLVVFAVAAAVVGAGTFFGYRFYQQRTDFTTQFKGLVSELVEVDHTLVDVDILMKEPSYVMESGKVSDALKEVPALRESLQDVLGDAAARIEEAHNEGEVEAFNMVTAAAESRLRLLDEADVALRLYDQVAGQMNRADDAWDLVLQADALAREATKLANSATTEEATVAARDKTNEAQEKMKAAIEGVEVIERESEGLKLAEWKTYMQKRSKALEYAVKTSDALLTSDRATATSANDSYNKAEEEAAELAADLPESISGQVREFYESDLSRAQSSYQAARAHVTDVDSNLRAKL